MNLITIAGSCLNQTPLDWHNNQQNIISAIEFTQSQNIAILCLPELAISGYGCEDTFYSDYLIEESWNSLQEIAKVCTNIIVSVGIVCEYENSLYNCVALIHNTKILGLVAKQELCGDGIHYEPRWFKPWIENSVTTLYKNGLEYPFGDLIFEINGIRIGFEICEDAWNGVRPAQRHYLNNVDIILNPSASHFAFGKTEIRKGLVVEASRSYSCVYVYSNLLGNESGRIIYDGEILIAQSGKLLARNRRFSFQNYQVLHTIVDLDIPRRAKKKLFSFQSQPNSTIIYSEEKITSPAPKQLPKLNDIEKQIYPVISKLEEFYRAEILGLFDYMRKSRSKGFTISLSGGADSSACAVLAAKALIEAKNELGSIEFIKKAGYIGLEETDTNLQIVEKSLICIYQATENSSKSTHESAIELANSLGAKFIDWSIQKPLDEYQHLVEIALGRNLNWDMDDIPLQNIQARARVPALWMIANIQGGLLLTTSNRSEAAVGYATMDGDTSGGLAPLGGIDKATLLEWLKWAQINLDIPALNYVNNLQPSAELRPLERSQTDEKDLMPYQILDKIEKCAIRDYQSPVEVFLTLRGIAEDLILKSYIKKFFLLWARNQWKRERYAPSFHLDDASLDPRSWCRFPILNGNYQKELIELDKVL